MGRLSKTVALLLPLALLAGCVAPAPPPAPPPPPPPAPTPPPPPAATNWEDLPLTPGNWTYAQDATGSTARFGVPGPEASFMVRCDAASRMISLSRPGASATQLALTTSSGGRAYSGQTIALSPPRIVATVPASDGFLDRLAFSRGRFTVATEGMPTLVIPAWPEAARAIEDCRK